MNRRLAALILAAGLSLTLAPSAAAQARDCPTELSCSFDVAFKAVNGITLTLDVYRAAAATGEPPAVLAIHGGGFRKGDKEDMQPEAEQLARDGFVVFAPNYRLEGCPVDCVPLSGTAGYDDLYLDLADAMLWVREHGDEYGADTTRVGAFGTSAGAQLALRLNYRGRAGAERADAAVGWSGAYVIDLRYFGVAVEQPDNSGTLATGEGTTLAGCAWGSSAACSQLWIEQSVTTYVDDCGSVACEPPARMVMGLNEGVIDEDAQGTIMLGVLEQAGIEADLRTYAPGESCLTGVAPVPAQGCGNDPGDCGASHAVFHNCKDPATGLSETEALAAFFGRHLAAPTRSCGGRTATIVGTAGRDRIVGTDDPDVIAARGARDHIEGGDGADVICGGDGADRMRGGPGRDKLRGGAGRDHPEQGAPLNSCSIR